MSLETITLNPVADAFVNQSSPTLNYGGGTTNEAGSLGSGTRRNAYHKFNIPSYSGVVKSIKLRLYINGITGQQTLLAHLMDSPYDDLWIEGVSIGALDPNGCTWDEYVKNANWPTPGGDFAVEPIGMIVIQAADPLNQYYEIDIPVDNFTPQSGKKQTLVLACPDDAVNGNITFSSRTGANKPELVIDVEIDGFDAPTLTAEPVSSTQLDMSWPESTLHDDNFKHYLLEQSPDGVGSWTTLATITDKATTSYQDTGLVVQGDVNDYDEDSDTYPNGRTKYYRISIETNGFGSTSLSSVVNATTIPAIRPVSLTFTPKSKYWDKDFIGDNRAYKPYGVEVIPSWYDSLDITEENYIDKLNVEAYFRGASSWPGSASETLDIDFIGGIIEGDTGYKPYKIKGKIYDTGGLYRKATTDKTTEQFDVTWPAPCPMAIPDGAYAVAPPALFGRPFSAGSLVPIDLSAAGQQSGEMIFEEDFLGTAPNDAGKWRFATTAGVSAPIYSTGLLGAPIIESTFNVIGSNNLKIVKILRGEGGIENKYNKFISKYTGGYKFRYIFRIDNWNRTTAGFVLYISTGMSTTDFDISSARGYQVIFITANNSIRIWRNPVVGGGGSVLLLDYDLSTDAPLLLTNEGKFFLVDIIISPYFSSSGDGDSVTVVYNIANTLSDVLNIDYKTHPYTFSVNSISHPVGEFIHYIGRHGFMMHNIIGNQSNAIIQVYKAETLGRIGAIGTGQGYGAKNLTHDQILRLANSPIPTFPITPSPELTSELCYIEGRIKNEYGAQSRTGEVDDYQGDTFNNAIPIGFLSVPKTGFVGSDVLIDASQSIDPEGGTLIYKYDFGDTETLETSQSSVSHQYDTAGTYIVKLIVEDESGLLSVEVESIITIYDAFDQFEEVSLMSPWESISDSTPSGTSITSHPELDYDTVQTMEGGNRVFSLTGQHHDPDGDIDLAIRITNAENEKDYFHVLYNQAKLITLDLVNFGKVRGVITDHKPSMAVDDQQAFQFSMTFQEIDVRQFE